MLLFRMVDLPRQVKRLASALPLDPTVALTEGGAAAATIVGWSLTPALLDPDNRRLRTRINRILATYAEAEDQPRGVLEAASTRLEEIVGDYRLARCLARTVEHLGYQFVAPASPLPQEPASLRALCYRRAVEQYGGYVPRAQRTAFLAVISAELETSPQRLEAALWADRTHAALLQRRPESRDGEQALQPARVIAAYNAAVVATVVAASSLITLYLDAGETTALKDLYRFARAVHVGVEITRSATDDLLELKLYGPGSRALVRSRAVLADPNLSAPPADDAPIALDNESTEESADAGEESADGEGADGAAATTAALHLPAPGGAAVAAVVARLAQRHAGALRGGWMRLLGYERRLFHVPLEGDLLDALRGDTAEAEAGVHNRALYDSAVEEQFARAFHAHEPAGRGGLVRGWRLRREPRTVVVDTTVFLPDFSFRRGEVEVYGEVIGFYTEEYLARKTRKLAALRGRLPLLLIVDRDLAPFFAATGFPVVTYKSGRQIAVPEVIAALEEHFDPFARRRRPARATLARLCATAGPDMAEEELLAAIGCAGRSELLALWAELASEPDALGDVEPPRRVAEAREGYDAGAAAAQMSRRYLPGYGLVQGGAIEAARAALHELLDEAGGPVALEAALESVRRAGIAGPDEALLERLGALIARADLFGTVRVYLPGMAMEDVEAMAEPGAVAPARPRRQRKATPTPDGPSQAGLPLAALQNERGTPQ